MRSILRTLALGMALVLALPVLADTDLPTKFSNRDTVANTRHNMTQRARSGTTPNGAVMTTYRNDYDEVCVYCHTPHGAAAVQLPLWNRTIVPRTYQIYSTANSSTISQPTSQPGTNSLACLSCHDGQTAIDSIINMPGSGRYLASQATSVNAAFLNSWDRNPGGQQTFAHANMVECMGCHATGVGIVGAGATDFRAFMLGTDLRDDHPVGVLYPAAGSNPDFKDPGGTYFNLRFFDGNGNGRPDKNEVRLYNTGEGFEVECGSCHDPHGVPSGGAGSVFNPTFLRVDNGGSALCLTCHTK